MNHKLSTRGFPDEDLRRIKIEGLRLGDISSEDFRALLARLKAAEIPCEKARQVLCDVAQLLDGWHSDVAWTEWDESVRKAVSEIMLDIENWRKSKGE